MHAVRQHYLPRVSVSLFSYGNITDAVRVVAKRYSYAKGSDTVHVLSQLWVHCTDRYERV